MKCSSLGVNGFSFGSDVLSGALSQTIGVAIQGTCLTVSRSPILISAFVRAMCIEDARFNEGWL